MAHLSCKENLDDSIKYLIRGVQQNELMFFSLSLKKNISPEKGGRDFIRGGIIIFCAWGIGKRGWEVTENSR